MRQVISIHVGQGGIQVGNSCWELFCLEHGIQPDGVMPYNNMPQVPGTMPEPPNSAFKSFFNESEDGSYVPRSIFVDLEPTAIDDIKVGTYRHLYDGHQLVAGKQDAASNYARGYYTVGAQMVDICLDRIRKQVDQCSQLDGFMIYHSIGGGTGSGFASLLLQRLSFEYNKKPNLGFTIFPAPQLATSIVEPYNSLLSTRALIQHLDADIVLENEAVYGICRDVLEVEMPGYTNLNRMIAQVVSSTTASMRFDGSLNVDLGQIKTNLVPHQKAHFLFSSYSPILPATLYHPQKNVAQITNQAFFSTTNRLTKCNPLTGKYLACIMMYHGNVVPKDVGSAYGTLKTKRTIQFVDWTPSGIRIGINYQQPTQVPNSNLAKTIRSICTISNSTAITQIFEQINTKFDKMYKKRAFVHWFLGEGMEEGEFGDAREELAMLERDYEEMEKLECDQQEG